MYGSKPRIENEIVDLSPVVSINDHQAKLARQRINRMLRCNVRPESSIRSGGSDSPLRTQSDDHEIQNDINDSSSTEADDPNDSDWEPEYPTFGDAVSYVTPKIDEQLTKAEKSTAFSRELQN
eukprot:IDg19615t1